MSSVFEKNFSTRGKPIFPSGKVSGEIITISYGISHTTMAVFVAIRAIAICVQRATHRATIKIASGFKEVVFHTHHPFYSLETIIA